MLDRLVLVIFLGGIINLVLKSCINEIETVYVSLFHIMYTAVMFYEFYGAFG